MSYIVRVNADFCWSKLQSAHRVRFYDSATVKTTFCHLADSDTLKWRLKLENFLSQQFCLYIALQTSPSVGRFLRNLV